MSMPALQEHQKITVLFRMEPGSLGPDGKDSIEEYCQFAEKAFAKVDADFARWQITPRYDKSLPELEYQLLKKRMSSEQAERYLSAFGKHIDELEEHLEENLSQLIEDYLGR